MPAGTAGTVAQLSKRLEEQTIYACTPSDSPLNKTSSLDLRVLGSIEATRAGLPSRLAVEGSVP